MNKIHTVLAGAIAGVTLAIATVTFAQPFGGMGHGPGMGMGQGQGPIAGVDPSVMVDSHLADLKAQLKIATAQEPAWQAFTTAAKQQAAGMQAMHVQMQQSTGTAPERMAQHAAMMQQRGAAMATMSTAFSSLYAVLTPEQKAVADQHAGMMSQRGMRHGMHAG